MKKQKTKSKASVRLGEKDFRVLTHPDSVDKRIAQLQKRAAVQKDKWENTKARIAELQNLAD
jgi:hypothetical protein